MDAAIHRHEVGPNAVIQMGHALVAHGGQSEAQRVFAAADLLPLLSKPPVRMVDQALAGRLHTALRETVDADAANRIARDAGRRTADYLLANRIPRSVQLLMRFLPSRVAARMLLAAISRNAWTFAGSGRVRIESGPDFAVEILDNPLAQPGCPWHCGVFERLFQALVSPATEVEHHCCCTKGAEICRFELIF